MSPWRHSRFAVTIGIPRSCRMQISDSGQMKAPRLGEYESSGYHIIAPARERSNPNGGDVWALRVETGTLCVKYAYRRSQAT